MCESGVYAVLHTASFKYPSFRTMPQNVPLGLETGQCGALHCYMCIRAQPSAPCSRPHMPCCTMCTMRVVPSRA